MKKYIFIICLVLIFIPNISPAETETIFADHKFVMGDNDSKNDARRMCLLEAKRKVLERAGTFIESHTKVKNYQLAKDEISAYSAALLKIDTVKEKWERAGDNQAVLMTVKAEVDTGLIEKRLLEIKQDASLQNKLQEQQRQLRKMEQKIDVLQKQLISTDQSHALPLRKERITTFKEIAKIEERYKEVMAAINARKAVTIKLGKKIVKYVEIGMTRKEVEYILGKPDRKITGNARYDCVGYGNFVIGFSDPRYSSADVVEIIYFKQRDGSSEVINKWGENKVPIGRITKEDFKENEPPGLTLEDLKK